MSIDRKLHCPLCKSVLHEGEDEDGTMWVKCVCGWTGIRFRPLSANRGEII